MTGSILLANSVQEFGNRIYHRLLLVFAEFGEDGQGQDFAGGAFGLGEAAFGVAETLKSFLQVEWDGVEDLRADLARGEELAELVAAGRPDHVLVPDMAAAGDFMGQNDAVRGIRTGFGQSRRMK